jgi:hypothetical protein
MVILNTKFCGDVVCILFGNLVHFSRFWYVLPGKIWQPDEQVNSTFPSVRLLSAKKLIIFYHLAAEHGGTINKN